MIEFKSKCFTEKFNNLMAKATPAKPSAARSTGHGGARPGAGRKPKSQDDPDDHYVRLAKARADHEEEKAALARMDRLQREGALVDANEVEEHFIEIAARVKAKFLAIPVKLAPQLVAITDIGEAEALLKNAIHEALREMAPP